MTASAKNIDFSNVKEGGNFNKKRIPSGDYLAKIVKVEDAKAKGDGAFQYMFTIQIVKRPSSRLPYYCKLQENQLWKLRNLFIAAGKSVPKKKQKVDPNSLVGKTIGVTVADSEYDKDGETIEQSEIDGVFPASDLEDSDDVETEDEEEEDDSDDSDDDLGDLDTEEEEEPEEEAEEEDDEEESSPYADLDRTALKQAINKLDKTFKFKSSQSDDDLREVLTKLNSSDDEDLDEEEEDEPAPAPKKKAVAKAAPAKKKTKAKAKDIDDDELEDLDIDDL